MKLRNGIAKGGLQILKTIDIDKKEEWDEIVRSFKEYDNYYLSGYVTGFQIHGDGTPILYYYENSEIRAINVVMKRDISEDGHFRELLSHNQYYDISTPYGYGGFIIEGRISDENLKSLEQEYNEFNLKNNIICEFVRLHPLLENASYLKSIYSVEKMGQTITMRLDNSDQIWSDLTSKNRNVIRKAIKSDVEIKHGFDMRLIKQFILLYRETMNREEAANYYYFDEHFYCSMLTELRGMCEVFYAIHEEEIISMALILHANSTMHYHLSASNTLYSELAATNLLLFKVAEWGSMNGYKTFHLGGGVGNDENGGLFKFKKSFNRNSNTYFSKGKKIFNHSVYKELVNLRNIGTKTEFFPEYRS